MEKQELMDLLFLQIAEQSKKWKIAYEKQDFNKSLEHSYASKVLNDFGTKINSIKWK